MQRTFMSGEHNVPKRPGSCSGGHSACTWSRGGSTCFLLSRGGRDEASELLSSSRRASGIRGQRSGCT